MGTNVDNRVPTEVEKVAHTGVLKQAHGGFYGLFTEDLREQIVVLLDPALGIQGEGLRPLYGLLLKRDLLGIKRKRGRETARRLEPVAEDGIGEVGVEAVAGCIEQARLGLGVGHDRRPHVVSQDVQQRPQTSQSLLCLGQLDRRLLGGFGRLLLRLGLCLLFRSGPWGYPG